MLLKKKENQVLRGMRRLEGLTLKTVAHGLRTINVEMFCSVVCEMLNTQQIRLNALKNDRRPKTVISDKRK